MFGVAHDPDLRTVGHLRRFEQAQTRVPEILGVGIGRSKVARQHLDILGTFETLADGRCGRQRVATGQRSDDRRLLEHRVELAGLRGHGLADVLHRAVACLLQPLRHRVLAPLRITVPAEPDGQQQQYAPNTGPLVRTLDIPCLRSFALLM